MAEGLGRDAGAVGDVENRPAGRRQLIQSKSWHVIDQANGRFHAVVTRQKAWQVVKWRQSNDAGKTTKNSKKEVPAAQS
ncbi:MAG: hypothetical protein ACTHKB_05485 [Burkholderiaceae bacterium]